MRFMKMKTVYYLLAMLMCMVVSCTTKPTDAIVVNDYPRIYPDYIGVTIPVDIAPLDFNCADETVDYMMLWCEVVKEVRFMLMEHLLISMLTNGIS